MDAIIMPSTDSLIDQLTTDFPQINFVEDDSFQWMPEENAITFTPGSRQSADAQLLHELSHALLEHRDYQRDIELVGLERDAWAYAKTKLAPRYHQTISASVIKSSLDTYRDWLHARSTCPTCSATGFETDKAVYRCIACGSQWRVNEARLCGLKRYKIKN